jgi:HSP20 family molecular chaperone IbpA
MSYFISYDDLNSNYYLFDPFGFTYNSINSGKNNSLSKFSNFNNNSNTNEEKVKKVKNKRNSFNSFIRSFSFLNKNHDSSISSENVTSIKQKQNKNTKLYKRAFSTPSNLNVNYNSPINNVNDKANKIELKRCNGRLSDLLVTQVYQPVLHVEEKNTHYQISVYLPDVKRDEINLEIFDRNIIICGERTRKINKYASFTKFNRTFNIPEDENTVDLKVNFKNDIFELILQKIKP